MMARECFNCGISEEKVRLYDAISNRGIDKICKLCSFDLDVPVLNRPTTEQIAASEGERISSRQRNYNSFSGSSNPTKSSFSNKSELLKKQETTLKDLIDKNFKSKFVPKKNPRADLVENFHWLIMRARRSKKLTQSQLAKEISESDSTIKMIEQGVLPIDDSRLIGKLESFLGIRINKTGITLEYTRKPLTKPIQFSRIESNNLTISDLKDIKEDDKPEFSEEPNFQDNLDDELEVEEMDEGDNEVSEK